MSIYGDKKLSLIEQKRLQWAKERELAQLSIPWGKTYTKFDKNIIRGKSLSKFSNSELSLNREEHYSNRNLPPITRNKSYDHYEVEGDTSGYASDAKEGSPEYYNTQRRENSGWNHWHHRSSESDVSICRDDRMKWGDRGLGVGHLWEPHEINEHISKTVEREPPGWLQRGLQSDNKEVLVVNSNSPESTASSSSTDRPFTGESTTTNMHSIRTHLRGQNIPLEPTEVAERERKRQKALELQNAIKQQLEEREMKRKQDRERKLREEAEEESRIRREQEIERLRVEEEQKLLEEKKERERKRNEAMQEALENAEKAAKIEKSKQKHARMKSNVLNLPEEEIEKQELRPNHATPNNMLVPSPRNIYHSPIPERVSPVNNIIPLPMPQDNNMLVPETREAKLVEDIRQNSSDHTDNHLRVQDNDSLTLVLQNPFDSLQGMQLALLVPTATMNAPTMNLSAMSMPSSSLPIAVPIPVNEPTVITENRVLTPSVYRMKKNCRESSTQTDNAYFRDREESSAKADSYRKEDNYGSLDRRRNSNGSDRKERRMRSEERSKESRQEKPKWGANKPPMRYMKQSEKDPAYQKRKMRQKTREIIYEDKNNNYSQSSDDSIPQTPDHRLYRKGYNRNLWHKNERMFSQNISVYQTEIVPLELDRQGRLYVKDRTDYREVTTKQKYRDSTPDSSRRLERITPRSDTRKERLNERNERRRLEREGSSFERDHPSEGLLVKLDNLRHGLLLKQQQWDDDNESVGTNKSAIEFPSVHDNP